jgi:hypothetical protein
LLYPAPDVTLFGMGDVLHAWASLLADTQTPGYMLLVLDRTAALGVAATRSEERRVGKECTG